MKNIISAVHRAELASFLSRVGILISIQNGDVHCATCGSTISLENFGAITRSDKELVVYCNSLKCVPEKSGSTRPIEVEGNQK